MKHKKKKSDENTTAEFWETHDATDVLDLSPAKQINLIYQPSVQSISLRLPVPLLKQIKQVSAKLDIAYQALIKIWLAEKAREEAKRV